MTKTRATDEMMGKLHLAIAEDLLRRVQSGEANPQELAQAIKFLKDNSIQGETGNPTDPLEQMRVLLPNFEDDEMIDD